MGTVNTDVKNVILESGHEIQYDEKAKRILGNKMIIAGILVHIIDEFEILMENELEEDLNDMCNLSQGVAEKSEAKGIIKSDIKHGDSKDYILADLQEALNIFLQKAQIYLAEFEKRLFR